MGGGQRARSKAQSGKGKEVSARGKAQSGKGHAVKVFPPFALSPLLLALLIPQSEISQSAILGSSPFALSAFPLRHSHETSQI